MERAIISEIKVSEEVMENRKYLFSKLKEDKRIQTFLKDNKLDEKFLFDNVQTFADWIVQLDLKDRCLDSDICFVNDGYYLDISYNGIINKTWKPCIHEVNKLKKDVFLDKYIIKDFPDSLVDISLSSIVSQDDVPAYKQVVLQANIFLNNPVGPGLYIHGEVGVGKTYLMSALANELAKKGKTIAFVHTPTLVNDLKGMISQKGAIESTLSKLKRADILVLDDIGVEGVSDWIRDDILLSVLDYRMHANKTCFYTSNLSLQELEVYYSVNNRREVNKLAAERLLERIKMTSREITIKGDNRRVYA